MLAFRTYLSGVPMKSVYRPAQLSIQISTSKIALKLGLAQYCLVFEHSLRWLLGPLVVKVLVKVCHSLGLTIPLVAISLRLGLHEDTPALAPFLGKEPIRRGSEYMSKMNRSTYVHLFRILVHAQTAGVRSMKRGEVSQTEKMEVTAETGADAWKEDSNEFNRISEDVRFQRALDAATTRFHFTTRIIVTDRILSIVSGMSWHLDGLDNILRASSDQETVFSHKWMLTVDAPSYVGVEISDR